MTILSLVVVVTGVKVQQIYTEQRFYSQAQQVLGQLALAQDMMLILDADVEVKIGRDPKTDQIVVWIDVEDPLSDPVARLIEKPLVLSAIRSFSFQDVESNIPSNANPLTLNFFFGKMSKGKLFLSEEKNPGSKQTEREFIIELLGYPAPIGQAVEKQEEGRMRKENSALYPVEVYDRLQKEKANDIKTPKLV